MEKEIYAMLFTPLASAALIAMCFRKSKWAGGAIASLSALAALCFALSAIFALPSPRFESYFELYSLGSLTINFGVLFDSLAANMIFVVCFVGFLIHIFSIGYMKGDESNGRFFAGMSFFMFSMTGIVVSSNLFMMFVFWELVGFSSYALIAHYADTDAAREASKKAFIVNRVGDFGFLVGIIWCQAYFGTTNFTALAEILAESPDSAITAMGILVMCGFLGKSAQFPLQVWLPDAMAGPTPVSALIHAATMVAAGVYMMARLSMCGFLTPEVLDFALVICSAMAFLAGLWALGQRDIKKILAYSTLAHLGLMGVGISLGCGLAMFHLTTHAFFKATLFLTAGSVICACHHEQDIFKMGGLFKKMPVTALVGLVATLSIMAIPFFAGYYSKDSILAAAFAKASSGGTLYCAAFWMTMFAAFLTPIYMVRFYMNVFLGSPRSESASHARESSLWMVLPLVILAVYSLGGAWGFVENFKWLGGKMNALIPANSSSFVETAMNAHHLAMRNVANIHTFEMLAVGLTFVGIVIAFLLYRGGKDRIMENFPRIYGALEAHGWFDNFYGYYVKKVQQRIAVLFATFVDLCVIELGFVRGLGVLCAVAGNGLKRMHSSIKCGAQAAWFVGGIILIFALILGCK